jgi:hypothetical protein
MLEPFANQAAGLQSLAPRMVPKLIAVASHGQQKGELPLLWSLCTTWVEMGLPVMVLDGHAHESDQNPGLLQMLANPLSPLHDTQESVSWSVLPAARGFQQLPEQGFNSHTVGNLFQNFGIVLLYADAVTLTGLLKDSGLTPLVVLAPLKASSLSAYQTLKQLLLNAHLYPTVANIAFEPHENTKAPSPVQNLQHCAMTFLGLSIKPITVTATASANDSRDEVMRLALQLMENATVLERYPTTRTH